MALRKAIIDAAISKSGMSPEAQTAMKFAVNPFGYAAGQIKEAGKQIVQRAMNPELASTHVYVPKSKGVGARSAEYGEEEEGETYPEDDRTAFKKGGKVKKYVKGGKIDGCAQRGKTRGKMV